MRFMVIMKASEESESGQLPSTEMLAEMGKFNEELVKAGVMLAGEGLTSSADGARVRFSGKSEPTVVDGPFAESKELVAGFWILQVRSKEEVIEWVKRVPNTDGAHHEIEIRRIAEAEDFGDNLTPELREAEEKLREQAAKNA
ncbi:YciI family protein [Amycolatopsis sp. NPDC051903]|uniref:YciI family protein n=1 Tax=Amycolatopsis sp. NPDC051903 TaxID=3363936 RepID=UPI0037B6598D